MGKALENKADKCIFVYNTVFPLTASVIEAMVLLLKSNMTNFKVRELDKSKTKHNGTIILVSGDDLNSSFNIDVLMYLDTHKLVVKSKHVSVKNTKTTAQKDPEKYFSSFCGSLEIMAHNYIKVGECYSKVFVAAKRYIDSNYDPKYAIIEDDGYQLNFARLFSPHRRR